MTGCSQVIPTGEEQLHVDCTSGDIKEKAPDGVMPWLYYMRRLTVVHEDH